MPSITRSTPKNVRSRWSSLPSASIRMCQAARIAARTRPKRKGRDDSGKQASSGSRYLHCATSVTAGDRAAPAWTGAPTADDESVHRVLHAAGIKPLIENRALWKSELERMLPGHTGRSNLVYDE